MGPAGEAALIERTRAGDTSAYDALVSHYLRRVVAIAWNLVRNTHDAEDIAQEAFVRAYQSIGRFRTGEPFGPWVNRIATNLALDLLKHRRRVPHEALSDAEPAARRDRADLGARTSELARRIDEALEELPEMQRVVARLHLVEQFEHAEIADMTALSEGTVRSHLSLARKKLRERLADVYGGGDD